MCGILGYITKKEADLTIFNDALATLTRRGPDSFGINEYRSDKIKIIFGHRRLAILDLSPAGAQPMHDDNENYALIFNGEIYNFLELKKELISKGYTFRSKTDTEVLLKGYIEWKDGIVKKIEGMFAFAIYDKINHKIILARDHFGKKPLYYYLDNDIFCFASELKAIIKNDKIKSKLKIDRLSLIKYLFYGYIPSPNSIFDKIKKLKPSTMIHFDIASWNICNEDQYWYLEDVEPNDSFSENEILEKTEILIEKAVSKRLISDVPLGVFLSGGADSSLIAHYLSQQSKKANSFTVGYKNSTNIDESKYAEMVAKKEGIKYNLYNFENKLIKENFIEILDYIDEPMADAAIIPLYYLSKNAKKDISVVLSGDGGDEIFCGYPKYKVQKFIEDYSYLSFLTEIVKPLINKSSAYGKLFHSFKLDFSSRQFILGSGGFIKEELSCLLPANSFNMSEIFEEAAQYEKKFKQKDIINKSLFLDCKIQLPDWYLVKGDRATMAASLEMRNPLLDKQLVELIFSLNGNWKIKKGEQKYILKKIAYKYFDREIIYRKKMGFGVPLDKWINNELKDLFQKYLFANNGFFNLDYIKKLYDEHVSQKNNHAFKLLRIFCFNYWHEKYYE